MSNKLHTLQWFKNRVGKRIYRDKVSCPCETCVNITKNGLTIHSEFHARYVYDTQIDYAAEGSPLNYRDKK